MRVRVHHLDGGNGTFDFLSANDASSANISKLSITLSKSRRWPSFFSCLEEEGQWPHSPWGEKGSLNNVTHLSHCYQAFRS